MLSRSRAKYDPNQPRHPSGSRFGGRWRDAQWRPSGSSSEAVAKYAKNEADKFYAEGGTVKYFKAGALSPEQWDEQAKMMDSLMGQFMENPNRGVSLVSEDAAKGVINGDTRGSTPPRSVE